MPIPNPNGGALTEEHVQIRESVRDFADREVLPVAPELDNKAAEIPAQIVKKMAELGYFGLIFSPDYGGSGLDTLSMAIVAEELSKAWLSVGSVMTRMIITASLVQANGTEERTQFGKPISEFQVIGHKLAHMATQVEAGRQLTYHAARMKDTGKRCDLEAGMAKAFCAEMAEHVTSEAMQIFGGYGYSREFPAQRFWRDARVFRIFEGTSEIQYEVIAKRLLEG